MRSFVCALFVLALVVPSFAQTVETVAGPSPRFNNGVTVMPDGTVLASDLFGSGWNGHRVYAVAPDGTVTDTLATGLNRPAGLVDDHAGNVFICEFDGGRIKRYHPDLPTPETIASGLNAPADLVLGNGDTLYATVYYSDQVVSIAPDGAVDVVASGFDEPVGIDRDDAGNLYVASLQSGNIDRIAPDGTVTTIATVDDTPIGFLCWAQGRLFVSSTGGHRIYAVDLDGTVSVFAGTGSPGSTDGPALEARFRNPDGIAATASGDTLYVTENNSNLLRRIVLTTAVDDDGTPAHGALPHSAELVRVYPNPFNGSTRLDVRLDQPGHLTVAVHDILGRSVTQLTDGPQGPGLHAMTWTGMDMTGMPVPSGTYLVRVFLDGYTTSNRLVHLVR